jgi:hypothetical protein
VIEYKGKARLDALPAIAAVQKNIDQTDGKYN